MFSFDKDYPFTENMAWFAILWMVSYIAYCTIMEWRLGATLGKKLLGLKTVGDDGRRPGLREVFLRNLVKIVELTWPIGLPLLMFLPVINRNRQRLGDLLARTAVAEGSPIPTAPPPQEEHGEEPPFRPGRP
jgi:uncharacterized RDD family membrane protein YckC